MLLQLARALRGSCGAARICAVDRAARRPASRRWLELARSDAAHRSGTIMSPREMSIASASSQGHGGVQAGCRLRASERADLAHRVEQAGRQYRYSVADGDRPRFDRAPCSPRPVRRRPRDVLHRETQLPRAGALRSTSAVSRICSSVGPSIPTEPLAAVDHHVAFERRTSGRSGRRRCRASRKVQEVGDDRGA